MNKEGWEVKKLGELCDSINGLWKGKKEPFINVGVIRNTNFTKDCTLNASNIEYLDVEEKQFNTRKLIFGDLIIEKSGGSPKQPVGRVIPFEFSEGNYSFSNFTSVLRIKKRNSLSYKYLYMYLLYIYLSGKTEKLQSNTTGIRNLNFTVYKSLSIPVPPLPIQEQIVKELDTLSNIIAKKKEQLFELDTLAQATFYEMFGDPVENEKGWEVKRIKDFGKISTGNTPSRKEAKYYSDTYIEWIKTDNITQELILSKAKEYLSKEGYKIGRKVDSGAILVTCIAGSLNSIGRAALTDREVCFNQQINAVQPNKLVVSIFLYWLLKMTTSYIQENTPGVLKYILSKSKFENLEFILPPLALQNQFAERIKAIEKQKKLINHSIKEVQLLFDYTMDKYFN